MKKLALLLFLPFASVAQDVTTDVAAPVVRNNELSIQAGPVAEFGNEQSFSDVSNAAVISYLHNFKNLQLGISIDGGYSFSNVFHIAPSVVCNNIIRNGTSYFYVGGTAGYYYSEAVNGFSLSTHKEGYHLGGQVGYVTPLSKRLSFVGELAVRSIQVWYDSYEYMPARVSTFGVVPDTYRPIRAKDFYVRVPVTAGFRYRF